MTSPADTAAAAAATPPDPEELKSSKTALAIGNLPPEVRQALIYRRQRNIVSAEILGTNWGKGLDRETRFRIAEWAQRVGIDPSTELNVLGGSFYKNAHYYLRRQAELMAQGVIEFAYADHVEISDELAQMALNPRTKAWAEEEIDRRAKERVYYKIDPRAISSVVWHIKIKGVAKEITAAKWTGGYRGKVKGSDKDKDPVGEEWPVETSETRAARRAMRLLADWGKPRGIQIEVEEGEDDTIDETIGPDLRAGLERARVEAEQELEQMRPKPLLGGRDDDPYALEGVVKPVPEGTIREESPRAGVNPAIRAPTAENMAGPYDEPARSNGEGPKTDSLPSSASQEAKSPRTATTGPVPEPAPTSKLALRERIRVALQSPNVTLETRNEYARDNVNGFKGGRSMKEWADMLEQAASDAGSE